MIGRPRNDATDDDPLSLYSALGPPVAYSPIVDVGADEMLIRLHEVHGKDARRRDDDLTQALARAASSKVIAPGTRVRVADADPYPGRVGLDLSDPAQLDQAINKMLAGEEDL